MVIFLRVLFFLCCVAVGFYSGLRFPQGFVITGPLSGIIVGIITATVVLLVDLYIKKVTVRNILSVFTGILLGLIINSAILNLLLRTAIPQETLYKIAPIMALIFCYVGAAVILRGQSEFSVMIPFVRLSSKGGAGELILLDTSVIIDGRIADICDTAFLSARLVIPRFVLKELQYIADSPDSLKRNRGRRGLDVLNKIKNNPNVQVKIHETDFPEIQAVDAKLVKLAQDLNAKIFTNDFNLNKIAELQGVRVLNINDLANALKPIVMPGEVMQVKIIKEGKEQAQGVAYLDDGTMIVVENAKKKIGQTVAITITSVLQTQAGRMIFAKLGDSL